VLVYKDDKTQKFKTCRKNILYTIVYVTFFSVEIKNHDYNIKYNYDLY